MTGHIRRYYRKYRHEAREAAVYTMIGTASTIIDIGVYAVMGLWIPYLYANIVSFSSSALFSFVFDRKYCFKVQDHPKTRFIVFLVICITGLGISEALIAWLTIGKGLSAMLSKYIAILIVAVYQFFMNKFIAFRRVQPPRKARCAQAPLH